jgi:hypothetical protein
MRCSDFPLPAYSIVGAAEKRDWDGETERLGGLEIDDEVDLSDLLHWEVRRLLALEDTAGVNADLTVRFVKTASVTHETASINVLAKSINCGN